MCYSLVGIVKNISISEGFIVERTKDIFKKLYFFQKKKKLTDHGLILQCPKILWQEKRKKKKLKRKKMKNEKWGRSRPTTVKSHSSMLHCHIFSFIICCMYVSVTSLGIWGLEPIKRRFYFKISKRQLFVLTWLDFLWLWPSF